MQKKFKIGITDDTNIMRCRLIVKLIEVCGATPVLIPTILKKNFKYKNKYFVNLLQEHLEKIEIILADCDALIFPGNRRDVHPNLYNENDIHPQTKRRLPIRVANVRQETEIKMLEYALQKQDIPVVAICGGMQLINAALGGNLIQHLPDDQRTDNSERENYHHDSNLKTFSKQMLKDYENNFELILEGKKKNIFTGTHEMKVIEGSLLAKIYQQSNPDINLENIKELSIHHQGCMAENLSDQLKISAISPDGVIEAAEHKTYPKMFLLTQFHPECNASGIALQLVENLIKAI